MRAVVYALLITLLAMAAWQVVRVRTMLDGANPAATEIARMKARFGALPLVLGDGAYRGRSVPEPEWIVERSGADAHAAIIYKDTVGNEYRLYIGGAARATGYFHKPDGCMPSVGWQITENVDVPFELFRTSRPNALMRRLMATHGQQRMAVYYWFQAGDDVSPNDLASSYFRFRNILADRLTSASYVVTVYVSSAGAPDDWERRATAFLSAVGPAIHCALTKDE